MSDFKFFPVVVVATGPSLSAEQCNLIIQRRHENACRVIVVNNAYRYVPNADILYGADFMWWKQHDGLIAMTDHKPGIKTTCPGIHRFCPEPAATRAFGTTMVPLQNHGLGLAEEGSHFVNRGSGGSGAFQAVGLAVQLGARKIVLVGTDCKKGKDGLSHVHGDHKHPLRNEQPFKSWVRDFESLASERRADIVNCTLDSAIKTLRRSTLEEELWAKDS